MTLHIGFPIFPDVTQLDFTGPFEVLSRLPGARCHLIAETLEPVRAQGTGLLFTPTTDFSGAPALDVVCVPGGPGHLRAMENPAFLNFLRHQAKTCRYITSVCTGSMVLAAAGLLRGYRATSHWQSLHRLAAFGASPQRERVVIDRNRMTGGGVTAGIDFGLVLAALWGGETIGKAIALQIEYAPAPPFPGDPDSADPQTRAATEERAAPYRARMAEVDARVLASLERR